MNKFTKLHIEKIPQPDVLSDTFLTPHIDTITKSFQNLRDNIDFLVNQIALEQYDQNLKYLSYIPQEDMYFKQNLRSYVMEQLKWHKPLSFIPRKLYIYPEGRCFDITTIAYKFVMDNINLPEFNILSKYIEEGGVFKIIWGGVDLELQTALQIGGYYVDIASDTVNWKEDKLTVEPLTRCDFYELQHYKDYARIIEPYHNCKVYRNNCLLEVALFFPFFTVYNETVQLQVNTSLHLALSSCEQNFIPITELDNFPTLPIEFQEKLSNKLSLNSNNLLSYQIFTKKELSKKIKTLLSLNKKQKLSALNRSYQLAYFINFTLNSNKLNKIE